jgi:putative transposase
MKAFKYRIYPTKKQRKTLQWLLDRNRELYNAALQERRDAWRIGKVRVTYSQQAEQLPEIKEIRSEYRDIYSQVLQDTLRRVDKAFDAFFRRLKAGEKPGYPRFRSGKRYDSFTYPQTGFSLEDKKLALSKIGHIKVKLHRKISGKIKTCTIKREGEHWYVIFICEVEAEKLPTSYEDVGIDLGVTHFAALSDGTFIDHPHYFRQSEQKLSELQKTLSRKKRGSHRREKAVKLVAKAYRKIRNQRHDFLHKVSRKLVNRYQIIVFEDLQVANITKRPKPKQDEATGQYLPNGASAKAGLNKSILDAGWSMFIEMTSVKAESAGRNVILVNPKLTSQICSGCGTIIKKDLSERWHTCTCGCSLDRDHNAAINILRLGRSLQEPQIP